MIKININKKIINIYNEEIINKKQVPILIHNSFNDDGKDLWSECENINCTNFILVNISGINWNDEMTPWECQPLYKGDSKCGGEADKYILELTDIIIPEIEKTINYKPLYYGIVGYSLGGLFAIYSLYKTNMFERVASVSGSLWYPNILSYIKSNSMNIPKKIYLSLGDTEKNSKTEMLKVVQDNAEEIFEFYKSLGIDIFYELNNGGHFKDVNLRIVKGIKNIID